MSDLTPSPMHPTPGMPIEVLLMPQGPEMEGRTATPAAIPPRPERSPARPKAELRAAAHAAWRAVQGAGDPALDAALDVLEAHAAALRDCLRRQEEALKILGLYASDDWSRTLARRALGCPATSLVGALPRTLYDPELADAESDTGPSPHVRRHQPGLPVGTPERRIPG